LWFLLHRRDAEFEAKPPELANDGGKRMAVLGIIVGAKPWQSCINAIISAKLIKTNAVFLDIIILPLVCQLVTFGNIFVG
jgi:hypothetical protein